jgi:hypothetical protein
VRPRFDPPPASELSVSGSSAEWLTCGSRVCMRCSSVQYSSLASAATGGHLHCFPHFALLVNSTLLFFSKFETFPFLLVLDSLYSRLGAGGPIINPGQSFPFCGSQVAKPEMYLFFLPSR